MVLPRTAFASSMAAKRAASASSFLRMARIISACMDPSVGSSLCSSSQSFTACDTSNRHGSPTISSACLAKGWRHTGCDNGAQQQANTPLT